MKKVHRIHNTNRQLSAISKWRRYATFGAFAVFATLTANLYFLP